VEDTAGGDIIGLDAASMMEVGLVAAWAPLLENIHLEYGNMLQGIGWTQGAKYYWQKAGNKGAAVLEKL